MALTPNLFKVQPFLDSEHVLGKGDLLFSLFNLRNKPFSLGLWPVWGKLKIRHITWAKGAASGMGAGWKEMLICTFPKINFTSFLILLMASLYLRCHAEIALLIKEN